MTIQQAIDVAWAAKEAEITAANATTVQVQSAYDAYKADVLLKCGPMALTFWDKTNYNGYPINYNGYRRTFHDDFDSAATLTSRSSGAGPWYCGGPHAQMGAVVPRDITTNPEMYVVQDSVLTLLARKQATGSSWEGGFICSIRSDGQGFAQSKGIFEFLMRNPNDPQFPNSLQCGFWGGPWLLAAGDYRPEITDNLIEIDLSEQYGGPNGATDKGIHTTVHIKPRRVPQPGDYPVRAYEGTQTDPQKVFDTIGGAKTFPATTVLADGQFHLYSLEITDDWVIMYFDGKSIARYPNFPDPRYPGSLPYFSTPLYMIISHIVNPAYQTSPSTISPIPMFVDRVSVYAK